MQQQEQIECLFKILYSTTCGTYVSFGGDGTKEYKIELKQVVVIIFLKQTKKKKKMLMCPNTLCMVRYGKAWWYILVFLAFCAAVRMCTVVGTMRSNVNVAADALVALLPNVSAYHTTFDFKTVFPTAQHQQQKHYLTKRKKKNNTTNILDLLQFGIAFEDLQIADKLQLLQH